jgi:hypothetical protein
LLKTENFPKTHAIFGALGDSSPVVKFMGKQNVAVSNGEVWKKQRKVSLCLYTLHNLSLMGVLFYF